MVMMPKGVCLVLREDDFSRFTSFNDVSWRKEAIPLVETMNKVESTLSYDLKGSPNELNNIKPTIAIKDEEKENVPKRNNDYLYRIAYVKHIEENLKLEQTELFEKSEIEELEKLLNSLKEKLEADTSGADSLPCSGSASTKRPGHGAVSRIRGAFTSPQSGDPI